MDTSRCEKLEFYFDAIGEQDIASYDGAITFEGDSITLYINNPKRKRFYCSKADIKKMIAELQEYVEKMEDD